VAKRNDIKSILVIGAGPIVIGQACEFDYSGTQACKALKEEGYRVILINSNPATIMTDPDTADATYIEPITTAFLEKIIKLEKPDVILPTVGGQTALNCALKASQEGILAKYGVSLIGADIEAIEKAEDRDKFNKAMANIGLKTPRNAIVGSVAEALKVIDDIGLPAIIRPSFTLGGSGGGVAHDKQEYLEIVKSGLAASPISKIQIDQSLIGYKEYEMEVVRDKNDNSIIICAIENIDPMGVHTGDSVTVAPALTLTDKEYQQMRNASIAVLREIGVETGGSNVQFAVNPRDGELLVIEMNPRVSRSSALASKATGFPIAKIAAKLAVGYTLDELQNDITKVTPASFEPSIDYVVTKIPRFTFEKFGYAKIELSSAMKSVGEAMSIGRSFKESLQKALCSMETGLTGLNEVEIIGLDETAEFSIQKEQIINALKPLAPNRILLIAEALRRGLDINEICLATHYDKWFVEQIDDLVKLEEKIKLSKFDNKLELLNYKKAGFSDARIAFLSKKSEEEIRAIRKKLDILPVYKKVDSCAGEFSSAVNYIYSVYEGDSYSKPYCEADVSTKNKVIILGGGPNRIGQAIEFDYACCHAAFALKKAGFETIMVNCNPETVSTDYDTSDRLYFEPLTAERVIDLAEKEMERGNLLGVILQYGGQTPLKLAAKLEQANIPIIGTKPDKIDLAEDRDRFKKLLEDLELRQPKSSICYKIAELEEKVNHIGYPVVIRPSYVLGGRAMEIIYDEKNLHKYVKNNKKELADSVILVDEFLEQATEFDVDAICDGEEVFIAGIMEHIELAGIHSGDSACSLPPYSASKEVISLIEEATRKLAFALDVKGLMNIQFAVKDEEIYIIEVNPRASRTVPFVAKATGVSVAKIAALVMAGKKLKDLEVKPKIVANYAVKEAIFPFERFDNSDVILGPEMKSTGEVMGLDASFEIAFAKAQIAVYGKLPNIGTVFLSVKDTDKDRSLFLAEKLQKIGFQIIATTGTANYLKNHNFKNIKQINKVKEGSPHIVDLIEEGKIDLVINTTSGEQDIADSYSIRRTTLVNKVIYFTTIRGAEAMLNALVKLAENKGEFTIKSLQTAKIN
jgi:carbamoyl-phosphate synthase large subunit